MIRHTLLLITLIGFAFAQTQPKSVVRARDLGIPFAGTPGTYNAITDVPGVEVGYATLIEGHGRRVEGKGPVRTGVTVIHPRGKDSKDSVFAGVHALNAMGEMTGYAYIDELGAFEGPVAITNTHAVGLARDSIIEWQATTGRRSYAGQFGPYWGALPVAAETADFTLNDINGFHVKKEHVFAALNSAQSGAIAEGNVGGGTGMICHGWKGGTGTSSRKLSAAEGGYTVGVLVQANHGSSRRLTIAGVPVGAELLPDWKRPQQLSEGAGSIIVIVATDAPLLPHQLRRIAKRASLGVGRVGGLGETSSGDIMLAFSTANPEWVRKENAFPVSMLATKGLDAIFAATVDATEEAIVNALIAAETMTGADNITVPELPHQKVQAILKKYGRLRKD